MRTLSSKRASKLFVNAIVLICSFALACSINKPANTFIKDTQTNQNLIPEGKTAIFCSNWDEFVIVAAKAIPGDVIQLKNGIYSGNITFSKSGTAEQPIIIIPESRGNVIINGNSKWVIDGKYVTVDGFYFKDGTSTNPINFSLASSHSRFINSAVTGWNLGSGKDTRWVTIMGTFNEVGYCFLRAKDTPGMMLEVVRTSSARNDHNIHHVYFGYFKDPGSGNGFETVRISTSGFSLSSSYTTLENCIFERCDGESEIISSKSGHNTFRNNTFLNSDGALTLRHGHDALVEGNFFINTLNRTSSRCNGVRVIGERQVVRNNYFLNLPMNSQAIQIEYGNTVPHKLTFYDQVKDAVIEHNTILNCDKGVRIGASKNRGMEPPRIMAPYGIFRNNHIATDKGNNASLEIEEEVLSKKLFAYSNNLINGKVNTIPSVQNLPDGIIVKDIIGNFSFKGAEAGVQNKNAKPLYQQDIAPYWVKVKLEAKDPDFVGQPW